MSLTLADTVTLAACNQGLYIKKKKPKTTTRLTQQQPLPQIRINYNNREDLLA